MSILEGATNIIIQGGNFTAVTINAGGQSDLMSLLPSQSARGGLLDAMKPFHSAECDEAILEIKNFVKTGDQYSPPAIYCLHGPAGVEQLALARSLALSLRHDGDHAASFFSFSGSRRTNWNQLIVTLAYQLAENMPSVQPFMCNALQNNPGVLQSSNAEQVQRLIIDPINQWNWQHNRHFRHPTQTNPDHKTHPRLILIYGLDESDDYDNQIDLIICIGRAARQLTLPFRFVFFSRPESHILTTLKHHPVFQGPPSLNVVIRFKVVSDITRSRVFNMVRMQYPFANRDSLPEMIWKATDTHSDLRDAVALLLKAYKTRQHDRSFSVLADADTLERIRTIRSSLSSRPQFSADDAMAALHVVSLFLFAGGRGRWDKFLYFASQYVRDVLKAPLYRLNYSEALEHATPKDQFIVKTTIWFDVLASITSQEPPKLIEYIRELFKPGRSLIGEPYTYSMLDPVGCENEVIWALAETSCLSYWKRHHEKVNTLSIRDLVLRASDIGKHLASGSRPIPPRHDDISWQRFLASEIFRTMAKLFLEAVKSGDHPHVPEVRVCVNDCYDAIMRYPTAGAAITTVRSTVPGFFICGALTDDPVKQHALRTHLMQNMGQEVGGNVDVVLEILEKIWLSSRQRERNASVKWRTYLKHHKILLV